MLKHIYIIMTSPNKFDVQTKTAIRTDFLTSNLSIKDIASKYNTTERVIGYMCRDLPKKNRKYSEDQKYKLIQFDENYFENIDSPNKAYFLGFITGDAHIAKDGSLLIELKDTDIEILETFKKELKSDHKIFFRERSVDINKISKITTYKSCNIKIMREKFIRDLRKHGINNSKSLICKIPDTVPLNLINNYIRGLFDSDGWWNIQESKYNTDSIFFGFVSSVESFIEEVQNILIKECNLNKVKIESRPGCWVLKYGGNDQCKRIFDYLYKNEGFKLKRKFDTANNHFNNIPKYFNNIISLKELLKKDNHAC